MRIANGEVLRIIGETTQKCVVTNDSVLLVACQGAGSCAGFSQSERTSQAAALVQQLGNPVNPARQAEDQAERECNDERQSKGRNETAEGEFDFDAPGVRGTDEKRQQRGENDRSDGKETLHESTAISRGSRCPLHR